MLHTQAYTVYMYLHFCSSQIYLLKRIFFLETEISTTVRGGGEDSFSTFHLKAVNRVVLYEHKNGSLKPCTLLSTLSEL
jgi:hypothetical protein